MCQAKQNWEEALALAKENATREAARFALLAEEKDQACRRWRDTEEKLADAEVRLTARQSTAHFLFWPCSRGSDPALMRFSSLVFSICKQLYHCHTKDMAPQQ